MRPSWQLYPCRIADEPATVLVDVSLGQDAPRERYPFLGTVKVRIRAPGTNGFPGAEESAELDALDDDLVGEITFREKALYLGRITSAGFRTYHFQVAQAERWDDEVRIGMRNQREYLYEAAIREDVAWSAYTQHLLPSARDEQSILNRQICEALRKAGDALEVPRDVVHTACFPDARSLRAFVDRVEPLGFRVLGVEEARRPGEPFVVQVAREDAPGFAAIDGITLPLYDAALELGGDYDGWETAVVG